MMPTPKQIAAATERIRRGWTPEERAKRSRWAVQRAAYRVPMLRVKDVMERDAAGGV